MIFTDYGVSGNAVFKISSYASEGDVLSLDLLPECGEAALARLLKDKAERWSHLAADELLRCIVNSAAARFHGNFFSACRQSGQTSRIP